jgi:[acyl-carrier-protein] S-malonyltransferase
MAIQEERILMLDKEHMGMIVHMHEQYSFYSLSHPTNWKRLLQNLQPRLKKVFGNGGTIFGAERIVLQGVHSNGRPAAWVHSSSSLAHRAPMKRAFLFPGQGAQYVGMLRRLKKLPMTVRLANIANEALGYDLEKIIEEGTEEALRRTSITQPALLLTSMAYWHSLPAFITEDSSNSIFMGHSIGEYTALVARQSLPFDTAISLVAQRGALMDRYNSGIQKTAMAVLTPRDHPVEYFVNQIKLCSDLEVDIAAINSTSQITISGLESDMPSLRSRIGNHGFKILDNVSLPFHSRFMQGAREIFKYSLRATEFTHGKGMFVSNVTGQPEAHDRFVDLLSQQITSTVLWKASIDHALSYSEIEFIEVGPQSVLSNMLRKSGILNKVTSVSETDFDNSNLVSNGNSRS